MCKDRFLIYFWILVCLVSLGFSKIVIRDIIGPSWVEVDNQKEFILDCDYVVSKIDEKEDEQDVVVKWFYNGVEEQIYQWITNYNDPKNPMVVGNRFKEHIDTSYSFLDDGIESYRALKLIDIDPTLSGNYTCKVSSDFSEHVMTKQVVIYSPASPDSFQIYYLENEEIIICDAANVAPKPILEISIKRKNHSDIEIPSDFEYSLAEKSSDGVYYNMSLMMSYNSTFLPEESVLFVCHIEIPGTNYTEEKFVEQVNEEFNSTLLEVNSAERSISSLLPLGFFFGLIFTFK